MAAPAASLSASLSVALGRLEALSRFSAEPPVLLASGQAVHGRTGLAPEALARVPSARLAPAMFAAHPRELGLADGAAAGAKGAVKAALVELQWRKLAAEKAARRAAAAAAAAAAPAAAPPAAAAPPPPPLPLPAPPLPSPPSALAAAAEAAAEAAAVAEPRPLIVVDCGGPRGALAALMRPGEARSLGLQLELAYAAVRARGARCRLLLAGLDGDRAAQLAAAPGAARWRLAATRRPLEDFISLPREQQAGDGAGGSGRGDGGGTGAGEGEGAARGAADDVDVDAPLGVGREPLPWPVRAAAVAADPGDCAADDSAAAATAAADANADADAAGPVYLTSDSPSE